MEISSREFAKRIRLNSLEMVARANASHIGSALSIADLIAVLYGEILNVRPEYPDWNERDRFILSKGHACVAVYAALADLGFFSVENLQTYGQDYSPLMNHICHLVPGVEFSTGSLGHGLPFGVGKALYAKANHLDWRVFVLLSDGELDEGSNWEALMFSAHHRLNNLILIIDYNKLQSLTGTQETLGLEPLVEKFKAFGAEVIEVDGHHHGEIFSALTSSHAFKPKVIVAHTIKGKGVSFMENQVIWHYRSPNNNELIDAINEVRGLYA